MCALQAAERKAAIFKVDVRPGKSAPLGKYTSEASCLGSAALTLPTVVPQSAVAGARWYTATVDEDGLNDDDSGRPADVATPGCFEYRLTSTTQTTTGGSITGTTFTLDASNTGIAAGQVVTGTGITGTVTVFSITGTTLVLNTAKTLNNAELTFTGRDDIQVFAIDGEDPTLRDGLGISAAQQCYGMDYADDGTKIGAAAAAAAGVAGIDTGVRFFATGATAVGEPTMQARSWWVGCEFTSEYEDALSVLSSRFSRMNTAQAALDAELTAILAALA